MKVEHIDHVAVPDAVNYIAQCAAQYAGHGKAEELLPGVLPQHPDDEYARSHANAGKEPALPAAYAGQKGKGRAVVGIA